MASRAGSKRTRGPNKQTPWSRKLEDGLSVLRLALDTRDPVQRERLEAIFSAAYAVRRALQRDARDKATAYWAAPIERERSGPFTVRERLGLSRRAFEHAAYEHLDGAPHLRRHVTKALAMHLADSVFTATEHHLFRDASGKTHGMPRVGRWFDFLRLPGRARSHTTERKWETFRLHGTLAAHREAYTGTDGNFFQPRRMRGIVPPEGSWWSYSGPLALVFTGIAGGALVLPVRLPAAPSNQPILNYHLSNPDRWHKVDLVRRRDPNAAGGWRYEAHLMVLAEPYFSPAATERRANAALETAARNAGIDVNVSNITIASHANGEDLRVTRIERDAGQREKASRHALKDRRRSRALERSRRAANPEQYNLSKRQEERARRREAAGLRPQEVVPRGPRRSRVDGKPLRAYRKDQLSAGYRRNRAAQAADAASTTQARRDHAQKVAGALVLKHGFRATVEDCNLSAWARLWGRALSAFSPGILLAAFREEAAAVAKQAGVRGGVSRASTRTTALSQHCLCGQRVEKRLGERVHSCPHCGLNADRDAVSAALGAYVVFADATEPSTATIDFVAARASLSDSTRAILRNTLFAAKGRQDAPSESTAHTALAGSSVEETGRTPRSKVVARQTVGTASRPTPDETGSTSQTTPERARTRTSMLRTGESNPLPPLRDSS